MLWGQSGNEAGHPSSKEMFYPWRYKEYGKLERKGAPARFSAHIGNFVQEGLTTHSHRPIGPICTQVIQVGLHLQLPITAMCSKKDLFLWRSQESLRRVSVNLVLPWYFNVLHLFASVALRCPLLFLVGGIVACSPRGKKWEEQVQLCATSRQDMTGIQNKSEH